MRIRTKIRTTIAEKSGQTELAHVFKKGSNIHFEDGYHHYFHRGSLDSVDQMTIEGLENAELYFLTPLGGNVEFTGAYRPDSGVINFVNCKNLIVCNLTVENYRQFAPTEKGEKGAALMKLQCSNAVNVENSTVRFIACDIKSRGKLALTVHSGSTVEITGSLLRGYYFELFNGASSITMQGSTIRQKHTHPDSHSAIWLSSRHRNAITNKPFDNGYTILDNCLFDMQSGRSLVSGNGSYDTLSNVKITNSQIAEGHDETFGLCTWHKNFNSIKMTTDFGAQRDPVDPIRDYIATPNKGFARFVNYYTPKTKGETRPGGLDQAAPIVIDGVSSVDV